MLCRFPSPASPDLRFFSLQGKYHTSLELADRLMSIPYLMAACIIPFMGTLVDLVGCRAIMLTLGAAALAGVSAAPRLRPRSSLLTRHDLMGPVLWGLPIERACRSEGRCAKLSTARPLHTWWQGLGHIGFGVAMLAVRGGKLKK
jgi:hypothetical protein